MAQEVFNPGFFFIQKFLIVDLIFWLIINLFRFLFFMIHSW